MVLLWLLFSWSRKGQPSFRTNLVLHWVFEEDHYVARAWKSHDWDAMDRLRQKGYIADPKSKAKSVVMTEEGAKRAKELFEKHFSRSGQRSTRPERQHIVGFFREADAVVTDAEAQFVGLSLKLFDVAVASLGEAKECEDAHGGVAVETEDIGAGALGPGDFLRAWASTKPEVPRCFDPNWGGK